MADQPSNPRRYRVLTVPAPDAAPEFQGQYRDLGVHEADRAERAVELAVDAAGIEGIDRCAAIPVGNWTECSVEEDPRPRFKARRINAPAEDPEADPDPEL